MSPLIGPATIAGVEIPATATLAQVRGDWRCRGAGTGRSSRRAIVESSVMVDKDLLFGDLCPRGVSCAESRGDDDFPSDPRLTLLPGEAARVARSSPTRAAEFATGRRLAHDAMEQIGFSGPVLSGAHGEPCWPEGVIGSITHCPGLRAAAVGVRSQVSALGIDAEPDRALSADVARALVMPADRLPDDAHALVALLCAKEAAAKAFVSMGAPTRDFRLSTVRFVDKGGFVVHGRDGYPAMNGKWRRSDGLVLAVVAVTCCDRPRF